MKKLTSGEIRQLWLDFFKSKGHMIEPGAALVPQNDPTLLWVNSGVAALKKYFDGTVVPKNHRITNAQKSIRTNDIENVGHTARHHTFFEMLGNFSIGDYFRDEVIPWAWELLTDKKWFGFEPDVIYITYHPTDKATYDKWISVGVSPSKLVPCEGNFWEIGEGPCGPNTEMFIDRGEKYDPEHLGERLIREDMENDRYIEIWNIVFSQFNAQEGVERSEYKELPHKNIDTGAGLERIVAILQDGETNFDTDLFLPIIRETEKFAKHTYEEKDYKMCFRVIADHIRTTTFALADGALFSNEGRGYVLRRILRRAVRYGKKLGINGSFMYKLVPTVAKIMESYYPYLNEKIDYIQKLISIEEDKFQQTLVSGENLLNELLAKNETKVLSGQDAFKLYDTYGFPYELTEEIAKEAGYEVDKDGFNEEMKLQKERARSARNNVNSMNKQSKDLMEFTKESNFIYEVKPLNAKVIGLFKDGEIVDSLVEEGDIILDTTCFYAEMGGEVADTGTLDFSGKEIKVTYVSKAPNKQHLHHVEIPEGLVISLNDECVVKVDAAKRQRIQRSHSACHLLQAALKIVLGDHIAQAGSFVDEHRCRFDFTHFEKISKAQLDEVERIVNNWIDEAVTTNIVELPIEEAKKLHATALFDDKYGSVVRVVSFADYSVEFCGGAHVANTSDIGMFVIESEESISSGVRRIEASVGINAYKHLQKKNAVLEDTQKSLGALSMTEIHDRLASLKNQYNDAKKEIESLRGAMAQYKVQSIMNNAKDVNGIKVVVLQLDHEDKQNLMTIMDTLKANLNSYFIYLLNVNDNSINLLCAASKDVNAKGVHCGNIIKQTAQLLSGNGGGRPDFAQAGGKDASKINEVLDVINGIVEKL